MMFDKSEKCTLSVEGMHCNHCKAKVESALKSVKGVKKAEADLASGDVFVTYIPTKVSVSELADAVNAAGFKASLK